MTIHSETLPRIELPGRGRRKPSYEFFIRAAVSAILIVGGLTKLALPVGSSLATNLIQHSAILSYVLSLGELVLAGMLLGMSKSKLPVLLSILVFGAFIGALTGNLFAAHPVPCGCFGRLELIPANESSTRLLIIGHLGLNSTAFVLLLILSARARQFHGTSF